MKKLDLIKCALYDTLPYRNHLDIKGNFGLEIEMALINEKDKRYLLNDKLIEMGYYDPFDDSMLYGIPFEIATPKLMDCTFTWKTLEELSNRMKDCELNFDYAAFQVNLDSNLTELELYHLVLFFRSFEHIIFKFSRGYDTDLRVMKYARSLKDFLLYNDLEERNHYALRKLMWNKRFAIALKNDKPYRQELPVTFVEFRTPNSSDDCFLWQNYVNTFYHLLHSVKNLDLDLIDDRLCHNGKARGKSSAILHLDDAITFSNMIFDKDMDKIYFLKHYIGSDEKEVKENIKTLTL